MGLPSVVSRTPSYERAVENGVTGFLCRTAEEWYAAPTSLLDGGEEFRNKMGEAAKSSAWLNWGESCSEQWARAFTRVMGEVRG